MAKKSRFASVLICQGTTWSSAEKTLPELLWRPGSYAVQARPPGEGRCCSFRLILYEVQFGLLAQETEVARDPAFVKKCVRFLSDWFKRQRIPGLVIDPEFASEQFRKTTLIGIRASALRRKRKQLKTKCEEKKSKKPKRELRQAAA